MADDPRAADVLDYAMGRGAPTEEVATTVRATDRWLITKGTHGWCVRPPIGSFWGRIAIDLPSFEEAVANFREQISHVKKQRQAVIDGVGQAFDQANLFGERC